MQQVGLRFDIACNDILTKVYVEEAIICARVGRVGYVETDCQRDKIDRDQLRTVQAQQIETSRIADIGVDA